VAATIRPDPEAADAQPGAAQARVAEIRHRKTARFSLGLPARPACIHD
jgi:hypothetical protein